MFALVKLAEFLCNVDKIPPEGGKLAALIEETVAFRIMLAKIEEVSAIPSVVVKDKDRLRVSMMGPFDNAVEVTTDTFFEEKTTGRDFDGAGELSIAVVMLLDVGSSSVLWREGTMEDVTL